MRRAGEITGKAGAGNLASVLCELRRIGRRKDLTGRGVHEQEGGGAGGREGGSKLDWMEFHLPHPSGAWMGRPAPGTRLTRTNDQGSVFFSAS